MISPLQPTLANGETLDPRFQLPYKSIRLDKMSELPKMKVALKYWPSINPVTYFSVIRAEFETMAEISEEE